MALINMQTAAKKVGVSVHVLQKLFATSGLEIMEGPKFGKGKMRFVAESDVVIARAKLAEIEEQKRERAAQNAKRIVEVGKRTRIVPNALMMEKLDMLLVRLDDIDRRLNTMSSSLDALHIRVGNLTQLWGCNESNTTVS